MDVETRGKHATMNTWALDALFCSLLLIALCSLGLLIEDVPSKSVRISCKTCSRKLSSSGGSLCSDDYGEMTKKVSKRRAWLVSKGARAPFFFLASRCSAYLCGTNALHKSWIQQRKSCALDESPNHRPMLQVKHRPSPMLIWNAYLQQNKWLWRLCGFEHIWISSWIPTQIIAQIHDRRPSRSIVSPRYSLPSGRFDFLFMVTRRSSWNQLQNLYMFIQLLWLRWHAWTKPATLTQAHANWCAFKTNCYIWLRLEYQTQRDYLSSQAQNPNANHAQQPYPRASCFECLSSDHPMFTTWLEKFAALQSKIIQTYLKVPYSYPLTRTTHC